MEQRLKLLRSAAGIYFFFITYGKLQEGLFRFRSPVGKAFTAIWFLQLIDALANVVVGGIGRSFDGATRGSMPQHLLCASAMGQVLSKYLLNASLAAGLSFPVATLAKSAKMVPVMIGSLILGGATFTSRQVTQAAAIVGGTSIVTLSEGSGKGKSSSIRGLALIASALACDGLVGGVQRRLKVSMKARGMQEKPYDMMFWTNLYMAGASLAAAVACAEVRQGIAFCRANPAFWRQILRFVFCGAMGQGCIFYTIANFDCVVCTAITTTRKLMSVLISLGDGDKSLPPSGWAGLALAAVGIAGEVA